MKKKVVLRWIICGCIIFISLSFRCSGDSSTDGGNDTVDVVDTEDLNPDLPPPECSSDFDCKGDYIYCNGIEKCINGRCVTQPINCDDGIECTEDTCDEIRKSCIHIPHDELCKDNDLCNGTERCAPANPSADEKGCVKGSPIICDDGDDCTKDYCEASTGNCKIDIKDNDNDGHGDEKCSLCDTNGDRIPDKSCNMCNETDRYCNEIIVGDDCDDESPVTYPQHPEICNDGIDNDCDRKIDSHDDNCEVENYTCNNPFEIVTEGRIIGSTRGIRNNYEISCGISGSPDAVYTFTITEPYDVSIRVTGTTSYIALMSECGNSASELSCNMANIFYFNLQPGTYYLIVDTPQSGNFTLEFNLAPPTTPPVNDTCSNATQLIPEQSISGTTYGANDNTDTFCASGDARDVFYILNLESAHDVIVRVTPQGGSSQPWVELRTNCNDPSSAIKCRLAEGAIRVYNVPAGTIYIVVEGGGRGGDFEIEVNLEPPTPVINVGSNITCNSPTIITGSTVVAGSFNPSNNQLQLGCGYYDSEEIVFQVNLSQPQDILLTVLEGSLYGASIRTICNDENSNILCTAGNFPMRFMGVDQGNYYLIIEKDEWGVNYDFMLSIEYQSPTPSFNVVGNETCATAYDITQPRGVYRGSTQGMVNNYQANCGGSANSPDAVFHLYLTQRSEVKLSLQGSSYDTVLYVREGQCDDSRREIDCNDDYYGLQSYLEFVGIEALNPGDYYIFVDGFSSSSAGNYQLYVEVNPI